MFIGVKKYLIKKNAPGDCDRDGDGGDPRGLQRRLRHSAGHVGATSRRQAARLLPFFFIVNKQGCGSGIKCFGQIRNQIVF